MKLCNLFAGVGTVVLCRIVAVLIVVGTTAPAATIVQYSNLTAWSSAINSPTLYDFEGVYGSTIGAFQPSSHVSLSGLDIRAAGTPTPGLYWSGPDVYGPSSNLTTQLGPNDQFDRLILTPSASISAIAFDLANFRYGESVDILFKFVDSSTYTITRNTLAGVTGNTVPEFFGFVSDLRIDQVTIARTAFITDTFSRGLYIDNVRLAENAVPEPNPFALSGAVLLAILWRSRTNLSRRDLRFALPGAQYLKPLLMGSDAIGWIKVLPLVALFGTTAFGTTIFNNFGPGSTHDGYLGVTVGDGAYQLANSGTGPSTIGIPFVAQITGAVDKISVGVLACGAGSICDYYLRTVNPNAVIMSLYTSGALGGVNLLEDVLGTGTMGYWYGPTSSIITGSSVLHPVLTMGTSYWLRLAVPNMTYDAIVWMQSINQQGGSTYLNQGTGWSGLNGNEMAFRITADAVPEPASIGLIALSLAFLLIRQAVSLKPKLIE